uniref:Uncharacterized protein n=1 Tax=Opuntia streptacantha TaxID=393608 RepID=A0A7C9DQ35_OPUST
MKGVFIFGGTGEKMPQYMNTLKDYDCFMASTGTLFASQHLHGAVKLAMSQMLFQLENVRHQPENFLSSEGPLNFLQRSSLCLRDPNGNKCHHEGTHNSINCESTSTTPR